MGISAARFLTGVAGILGIACIAPAIARGQQDSGVILRIQFASSGSVFQTGEIIPVDLLFSDNGCGTCQMSTRSYDRSGRLNLEEFHVSPPGRDPLHDHYEGGIYGGFIGGGLSGGDRLLTVDPEIIREDLNEWVALDKPGHYSLYVTSGRVSRRDGARLESLTLRSNTLEFDIVDAGPAWGAQTLAAAAAALRDAGNTPGERRSAVRTLRFLDTPDSVRELVHQLAIAGDENRWDLEAGILGTHHRREAAAELEAQLIAPDTAITSAFLNALAEIRFLLDHEPMPPYPAEDKVAQAAWSERQAARLKEFGQLEDELYARTAALVASKRGTARAETVRTLLLRPVRDPSTGTPLNGLPEAEAASAFLAMTPREQSDLLQTFWERLKTPAMTRTLETVLDQPDRNDETLRGMAIQRLFELDPRAARPYILAEIRKPQGSGERTMANALTLLPDETLPDFDETLATRLEAPEDRTMPLDARLIGRYATEAILPRVKVIYQKHAGRWACDIEDGLGTYFLRVAADYGIERVRAQAGRCMEESLKAVVANGQWSAVEPSIIARLNDAEAYVARDAAETLARYGSAKAEKALWQRLRAFHRQWADREAELAITANTPRDVSAAVSLQFDLVESLGRAQAWLLDNDQLTELAGLTLGSERQNVESWHWHSPVRIDLTVLGGQVYAGINGCFNSSDLASLEAKLAQFPRGTVFQLSRSGAPERLAAATRAIQEAASANGFTVEDRE